MIRDDEATGGPSYWPSVTDLFMTLFIVAIALVGSVLFVLLPAPVEDAAVQAIEAREEPPIIVINTADRFFALGSAALTPAFEAYLGADEGAFRQIAEEIQTRNGNDLTRVDTLEIIGHTDGIPLKSRGNLDTELPGFLSGAHGDLAGLKPGSNNDLGLLRALAVKQAWGRFVAAHPEQSALAVIAVRTYSAGQTLPVEPGSFKRKDERARRIELRLTKLERTR